MSSNTYLDGLRQKLDRRMGPPKAGHPLRRKTDWPSVNPMFGQPVVSVWKQIYTTNEIDFARLVANGCLEASATELTPANRRAFIGVCTCDTLEQANQIASMMLSINTLGEHTPSDNDPWTTEVGLAMMAHQTVQLGVCSALKFHIKAPANPMTYRWLFLDVLPDARWEAGSGTYLVPLTA